MVLTAQGYDRVTVPGGVQKNMLTWHFRMCFSEHGEVLMVGLGDLAGLFQPL